MPPISEGGQEMPQGARACWCCAFYGLLRAGAWPGGVCIVCALLPQLCEHGHRIAARYEAAGDD